MNFEQFSGIDKHLARLPWHKRLLVRWRMRQLIRLKMRILKAESVGRRP